jgi:predicted DNA-binding transcriptional regulator YafY
MSHAENRRELIEEIERLLQLRSPGWTPTELAKELGCDKSTIHRALVIIAKRQPLIKEGKGRYRLDPLQVRSAVRLSHAEALTIYLALRRFIRQTSSAPDFFVSAIQEIATMLRHPMLTTQLAQSSLLLEAERKAAAQQTAIWETLIRGWYEKIPVKLRYQKGRSDALSDHEFEPYLFEPAVLSHGVYVIGWSRTRQELRTFKVDRIKRAMLGTGNFTPRAELQPDVLLRHSWGVWYGEELTTVELLFDAAVASRVQETIWHPSQKTELLPNGALRWTVAIAGTLELVAWIRGWGHEVQVIGPERLKQEIAESLRLAAARYKE